MLYVVKGKVLGKDGERGCCQLQGRRGKRAGGLQCSQELQTLAEQSRFSLTSVGGLCSGNTRSQKLAIWGESGGLSQRNGNDAPGPWVFGHLVMHCIPRALSVGRAPVPAEVVCVLCQNRAKAGCEL